MLDIRWLEDLRVIAETGSLTKASALRNLSQSGLSRRLRSLETWAGAPLIDRDAAPLALTEAGRVLCDVVPDVLAQLDGARRAIRNERDVVAQTIRIAAPHILSSCFFPTWLPVMQMRIGQVRLRLTSDHLPACFTAFESGTVDFVVCLVDEAGEVFRRLGPRAPLADFASIRLGRETLIPLSAPDDAGGPRHSLEGDGAHPVSVLRTSDECSLAWALDGALEAHSDLPNLATLYENSLAESLRAMAVAGLGAAWLPQSIARPDIESRRLVRAGHPTRDVDLDVRIYRPARRLSRRAEQLWASLADQTG